MLLLLFFEIIIITVKINFNKHTQKDRDRQRTRGHIYIFSLLNKAVYGFCLESVSSCQSFDFEMTCFETHSIASRTSLLYVHRLRWNSLHTPMEFVWDRTWMVLEVIKMQTATNACGKSDRSAIDFPLLTIDNNYNKYIHLSFIDAHVHLVDCHYFPTILYSKWLRNHIYLCAIVHRLTDSVRVMGDFCMRPVSAVGHVTLSIPDGAKLTIVKSIQCHDKRHWNCYACSLSLYVHMCVVRCCFFCVAFCIWLLIWVAWSSLKSQIETHDLWSQCTRTRSNL